MRIYSLLDYTRFTLLVFGEAEVGLDLPNFIKVIRIDPSRRERGYWTESEYYMGQAIMVRPDSYIHSSASLDRIDALLGDGW